MAKRITRRRRIPRARKLRTRSRLRRTKRSLYSPFRRVKKARRNNRGRLNIQRSFTTGGSLPQETSTRVFWRGSGVIDITRQTSGGIGSTNWIDQTFCLSSITGPVLATVPATNIPSTLRGRIAYAEQWISLYNQAIITGSKIRVVIRNTLYPQRLAKVITPSQVAGGSHGLPPNMMHGFWYIRYYYARYNAQATVDHIVGFPPSATVNGHWHSMRDFMTDTTVTWVRDRLPKATKMHYTAPRAAQTTVHDNLFPEQDEGSVTYEVEYSNKPIKLIAAYSRRKHTGADMDDVLWEQINGLNSMTTYTAPTSKAPHFYVTYGYVGFTADGSICVHTPADRLPDKQVEVTYVARLRLRNPKVEPWDSHLKDEGQVPLSREVPPEMDLEVHGGDSDLELDDDEEDFEDEAIDELE